MRGKIKAIFEKEKTYGITFNGNDWYVGFISDKPDWLIKGESEGTEVEFEYAKHKSDGREYNNIVKGSLKKVEVEKPKEPEQKANNSETSMKDRINELNKQVLELSKQLMYEKTKQHDLDRRDIRKSVCLKASIDLVNNLESLFKNRELSNADFVKLILYFAKEFEKYFENE